GDSQILAQLQNLDTKVILIINKIDLIQKDILLPMIKNYGSAYNFHAVIPVSAKTAEGIDDLNRELQKALPNGPKYFPDDAITDQPERFIVAEIIREKILELLEDEVPHGTGVEVISFKERSNGNIIDLEVNIYCEKESHKGIIIGKNGRMLKLIGTNARTDIEKLLNIHIYLQLWVKTKKDWRNNNFMLKSLGYE
ncbi:MAG: GTPase Era, partial [Bacteroidales bacterium]|nr:GTPase Era [Bacteroidales bacterium]